MLESSSEVKYSAKRQQEEEPTMSSFSSVRSLFFALTLMCLSNTSLGQISVGVSPLDFPSANNLTTVAPATNGPPVLGLGR